MTKLYHSARVAYAVSAYALHHRASLGDAVELGALCALALVRCESPTANLMLGQVRAKARRIACA